MAVVLEACHVSSVQSGTEEFPALILDLFHHNTRHCLGGRYILAIAVQNEFTKTVFLDTPV